MSIPAPATARAASGLTSSAVTTAMGTAVRAAAVTATCQLADRPRQFVHPGRENGQLASSTVTPSSRAATRFLPIVFVSFGMVLVLLSLRPSVENYIWHPSFFLLGSHQTQQDAAFHP
ncbi:predicted protein [Thalassiosira pseudonana CCMP1335]|uniref:Uncharacterized protein n=1 Tax=Thalassiosira pseudonana TaxID=35128 RepID=B8C8X2_THAPS|nr:predicted protein [Thalassiosira pseudonana CCMP1335]EED89750.1 predicted protein [Thalassiosira pseudonana CCMP1335]|eukprot:scaffold1924_cov197-Alexandrium_tamarense.AAC.9